MRHIIDALELRHIFPLGTTSLPRRLQRFTRTERLYLAAAMVIFRQSVVVPVQGTLLTAKVSSLLSETAEAIIYLTHG